MTSLQIGLWIPEQWKVLPEDELQDYIQKSNLDILLIPENHDSFEEREKYRQLTQNLGVAIYVGLLDDDGWRRGVFYDIDGSEHCYTKHATAKRLAFEESSWSPDTHLPIIDFNGVGIGTTICHDHYLSPLMAYQSVNGADVLLNLSATPVKRRKWGEILQARAIENRSYVFCTMHATEKDGTQPISNQPHAFAFTPSGQPLNLIDVQTGNEIGIFDTTPGSVYIAEIDESFNEPCSSRDSSQIERIRVNESQADITGDTVLNVTHKDDVKMELDNELRSVPVGASEEVEISDRIVSVIGMTADEALQPEKPYLKVKQSDNNTDAILFNVDARKKTKAFRRNNLDPVLRARSVEWCSPVYVVSDEGAYGFHLANTSKDTHRLTGYSIPFELKRAWGTSSAFKPVDGRSTQLKTVAEQVNQHRSRS